MDSQAGAWERWNLKPNIVARQRTAFAFANKLKGVIGGMKARGLSQRAICDELNQLGVKTSKGSSWPLIQLQRVIGRF